MAEPISIQQLKDASLDVKSLEEVVNGDENVVVTTRLGETYPSVKGSIKTLFENGGLPATPFATKALMTASALVDGDYAQVTDDTDNNGLYVKTAGAWVKSAYDPLAQAAADATAKANQVKVDIEKIVSLDDDGSLLLNFKDKNKKPLINMDKMGQLYIPHVSGSLQDALNSNKDLAKLDERKEAVNIKDKNGNTLAIIDNRAQVYLAGLGKSVQALLLDLINGKSQGIDVGVSGEHAVGKALYVDIPKGFQAKSIKWKRNGAAISGAIHPFYILKADDLHKQITVEVGELSGGYDVSDNSGVTIGGVALEQAGAVGSLYEGYVLSAGDDFTELDIIAPHKPLGRWFTTRTYLAGARGSNTLLGTMYDTDPYHLGYNDSNRGVPVGYDNMSVENSVLTLNARVATDAEKRHFEGTGRNEVASMISSVGAFSMYAGAANGGENILEFRVRHSHSILNPQGWHPSLWTQSSLPSVTYGSDEWDISEGTNAKSGTNYNEWGVDGNRTGGQAYGEFRIFDGFWHTVTAIFSHAKYQLYIDGVFIQEALRDTNSFNEPAYALVSNHIYNGVYGGVWYKKAEWNAMTRGATQEVDFIRLWRKASKSHIKPISTITPVNIAYGATGTITLPSKMDLWGRDDVLEHVQTVMTEENEPAGNHNWAYNSLPNFIVYDSMTRTATINTTGQKSGRLNFVIYGYLQDGSTCEPARTYVNVAPRINIDVINMTANTSYDLYAVCDCGVLVTDGVKRTKVIDVTGLPLGATYNDNTGFIYSNNAALGTYSLQVTCINSVGQSTTKTINLTIA